MPFVFKRLALLMSITAVVGPNKGWAADKDRPKFEMEPAASYLSHQTSEKVTIGASICDTAEKVKTAFGKLNPYQYGILPVLVVIQNDSDKTIKLDRIKAEYVDPGADASHGRVDATPAREIRYLRPPQRPGVITGPGGIPKVLK